MIRILLFLVSLFIGSGLFVWVGKIVGWEEIKNSFLAFKDWQYFVILGLTLLMAAIGTLKWKEILKGENVKISFKSLFGPYLAGYSVMFLMPIIIWGGEILRGYSLKERYSVPWPKAMASIIIDRIFEWTVNLAVIILGIAFLLFKIHLLPQNLEIIFGTVFLVFVTGITFFYFKVFKKESIIKALAELFGLKKIKEKNAFLETENEIFDFFKIKNDFLWNALGLSFLRASAMWLRVWLLILFLGKISGGLPALSILGFNYMASMIPIPTALGSHEAIQTFAFSVFGLGRSNAAVFTMIIRGVELTISLLGLVFLFKFGTEFLKKLLFKKIEKLADKL
jgi:uncharacterized protein (TIRG00374 family)